jgi:hypothetical protein
MALRHGRDQAAAPRLRWFRQAVRVCGHADQVLGQQRAELHLGQRLLGAFGARLELADEDLERRAVLPERFAEDQIIGQPAHAALVRELGQQGQMIPVAEPQRPALPCVPHEDRVAAVSLARLADLAG